MSPVSLIGVRIILISFAGFVIEGKDAQEIAEVLPDKGIAEWRWPYIHEAKIPIPSEEPAVVTTPQYELWRNPIQQDLDTGTKHPKRRRKKKRKKKKDHKDLHSFVAPAVQTEFRPPDHALNYEPSLPNEAKVHIMPRNGDKPPKRRKTFEPPDEPIFSASATLMDFDEDPSNYLQISKTPEILNTAPKVVHSSYSPGLPLSHVEDFPEIMEKPKRNRKRKRKGKKKKKKLLPDGSPVKEKDKKKQRVRIRIPVRALMFSDDPLAQGEINRPFLRRLPPLKYPVNNPRLLTLHSPTRIFIPIWEKGMNDTSLSASQNCIRCPTNATLIAKRGENNIRLSVPPVAICPSLARRPGTLNLAVTSGPRPGTRLTAGEYPIELIAWKSGGHVSACQYTAFVKVRKCPTVTVPDSLEMECTSDRIWGSVCKFKCSSRSHVLRGVTARSCEENGDGLVDWTAPLPNCMKDESVALPKLKHPCKEPKSVTNGAIACAPMNKTFYPDKTVCQYFCYPGFTMDLQNQATSVIQCDDGSWSPEISVKCMVDHCLSPDVSDSIIFDCGADQGHVLNGKTTYSNGTTCQFQCKEGFVIAKNLPPVENILCLAPDWTNSAVPDCIRALPPVPDEDDCRNVNLVVDPGESVVYGKDLRPPRFRSSEKSKHLTPTCTLAGKKILTRGSHINNCKVEDPQTGLSATCSYSIKIRERMPPRPDMKDCSNKIIYVSDSGTAELKIPKFYSSVHKDGDDDVRNKISLQATCTYSGQVGLGTYENWCTAFDPELNVTGNCSYSVEVRAPSCPPLKKVPNGKLKCVLPLVLTKTDFYPPNTTCEYSCSDGYFIPSKYRIRKSRKCLPSLKWSISVFPMCKKAVPPRFYPEDCQRQSFFVQDIASSLQQTLPRVKTSNGIDNVQVHCSLNGNLTVGNYTNYCKATDLESNSTSTCIYDIVVRARACLALIPVESADVMCSVKVLDVVGHPISSVCSYVCLPDHVIPTSQLALATKTCMDDGRWNDTRLPSCAEKIYPEPENGSCQDVEIVTNEISNVTFPIAVFASAEGNPIRVNCTPNKVEDFGVFNVSCYVYDGELRTSNVCYYRVTVLPTETSELLEYDELPMPVDPGCFDQLIDGTYDKNPRFLFPEFKTARNTSAEVTCTNLNVTGENFTRVIRCDAIDLETNATTICEFNVTVYYPAIEKPNAVKEEKKAEEEEKEEEKKKEISTTNENCDELDAPENGYISCNSPDVCKVSCDTGYSFSSSFSILQKGEVICDKINRTWDFQREYNIKTLDCLRELPTTSVEVWLRFEAGVEKCDDPEMAELQAKITNKLLQMNHDVCRTIECDSFEFNCTRNNERDRLALMTTWTIRASGKDDYASYNPEEYEYTDLVPLPETQMEDVMEITQKAVTTSDEFRQQFLDMGLELWQNSYYRGRIILVCDERGFVIDPKTDKCVECPKDTAEINRQCEPCPENYHQNRTGQTTCLPCSSQANENINIPKCLLVKNDELMAISPA